MNHKTSAGASNVVELAAHRRGEPAAGLGHHAGSGLVRELESLCDRLRQVGVIFETLDEHELGDGEIGQLSQAVRTLDRAVDSLAVAVLPKRGV